MLFRSTFDALFAISSRADRPRGAEVPNPAEAWSVLKLLRNYAKERGWTLGVHQTRSMFEVGVRWDELRRVSQARKGEVKDGNDPAEMARRAYMAELRDDFLELPAESFEEEQRDSATLERFALVVVLRDEGAAKTSAALFRRAMEMARPPDHPVRSPIASHLLVTIFRRDPSDARRHLHAMLDHSQLPTKGALLKILREHETTVDPYAVGREALDAACGSGRLQGTSRLDALLGERLAGLEREEARAKDPTLAFARWIVFEREGLSEVEKEEWLFVTLRLWETVFGQDDPASHSISSLSLLSSLIQHACTLASRIRLPGPPSDRKSVV